MVAKKSAKSKVSEKKIFTDSTFPVKRIYQQSPKKRPVEDAGKFPFKTKDTKLNDELSKAVLRGNLKATSQKKTYSEADIIIVSINCDLLKKKRIIWDRL